MSIIDTAAHSVVAYVSGTTKPFAGQRLSTITYKTVQDKLSPLYGIKRESKCVSLPLIPDELIAGNMTALLPHVREMLQGVQDKIIRARVDASASSISQEEIDINACIDYLDSNNESGRLTKESVSKWFNESIADNLMVALAENLGISEAPTQAESDKVNAIVTAYRDKISALAGGKTSYDPKTATQLGKALAFAPAGDSLADRFNRRLEAMKNVKPDDLLDAL